MRYLDDDDRIVEDGESVRTRLFLTDTFPVDADLLSDHRPGFRIMSDAQRAAVNDARDEMVRRARAGWKGRKKNDDDDDDNGDDDDRYKTGVEGATGQNETDIDEMQQSALNERHYRDWTRRRSADAQVTDARRLAYDGYVKRLTQAWKRRSIRDASEPDNSSSPEVMRRFLRGGDEPDHDAPAMLRRGLQTEPDDNAQAKRDRSWQEYKDRLGSAWQRGRNTDPNAASRIEQEREEYLGKFER